MRADLQAHPRARVAGELFVRPETFQVLVNGYTGSTAGDRPVSWVKVFFYIMIPAILMLIIIALVNSQEG